MSLRAREMYVTMTGDIARLGGGALTVPVQEAGRRLVGPAS